MTKSAKSPKNMSKNKLSVGQTLFCVMSAVAMILTFRYSEEAISAMSAGMRLCVNTVIPSLFPFMVLSELLISSGAGELIGKYPCRPLSAVFGISPCGATALLTGFICGFPIGAKSAISLYEKGSISQSELEHICTFCNNPSSAFLIGAVGSSLFGSRLFGVLLYVTHLISSCIIGFFGRIFFKREATNERYVQRTAQSEKRKGAVTSFIDAVTDSASSMLFICAFVLFFSALVGVLGSFAESMALPESAAALMFGFFEMTGGVSAASALPLGAAIPIAAAITGWSGLSVHFQFVAICKEHRFALRPYFVSKIVCSALNVIIITALVYLMKDILVFDSGKSISSVLLTPGGAFAQVSVALFASGCALLRKKSRTRGGK